MARVDPGWQRERRIASLAGQALIALYPCVDCGVRAGANCLPEYGCLPASRRFLTDAEAMTSIHRALDGVEWSPDTLETVATILLRSGRAVRDVQD